MTQERFRARDVLRVASTGEVLQVSCVRDQGRRYWEPVYRFGVFRGTKTLEWWPTFMRVKRV